MKIKLVIGYMLCTVIATSMATIGFLEAKNNYNKKMIERREKEKKDKEIADDKKIEFLKKWNIRKQHDKIKDRDVIILSVLNKECTYQKLKNRNGSCSRLNIALNSNGDIVNYIDVLTEQPCNIEQLFFRVGDYDVASIENYTNGERSSCSKAKKYNLKSIRFPYNSLEFIDCLEKSKVFVAKMLLNTCDGERCFIKHEYNISGLDSIDYELKIDSNDYIKNTQKETDRKRIKEADDAIEEMLQKKIVRKNNLLNLY